MEDSPFYMKHHAMKFSKRNAIDYWKVVSFTKDHTCHETPRNMQVKT